MIPVPELASIATSGLASTISVIFIAVTFLIEKYDENSGPGRTESEYSHYQIAIFVMVIALSFALLGIIVDILAILGIIGDCGFTLALSFLILELVTVSIGIFYIVYMTVGLVPFSLPKN